MVLRPPEIVPKVRAALSCKFQLKTNKDYIYITGQTSVNYTCQDITDNCFKTGDLQVTDASNCTGAGLNSFTLGSIESVDVAAVKAAMEKKISGSLISTTTLTKTSQL